MSDSPSDSGFTAEGAAMFRARSPVPYAEAAKLCQRYHHNGGLTPLDARRLVESVEAILTDQVAIRGLVVQIADNWRPLRNALNELHRIAVTDVVSFRPKRRRR